MGLWVSQITALAFKGILRPLIDSDYRFNIAPNLLQQDFAARDKR
jgi:hypothetical protein